MDQIKERAAARQANANENDDYNEYQQQLYKQMQQLVDHKELTDAQARKLYQTQLLQQMEYSKLLKVHHS